MTEQKRKAIIIDIDDTINVQDPELLSECESEEGFDWEKYKNYLQVLPNRQHVINMSNKFYEDDYTIIVVTARKFSGEYHQLTTNDLDSRGVRYHGLYMMSQSMSEQCNELNYKEIQVGYKSDVLDYIMETNDVVLVIDDLKGFCAYAAGLGICTVNPLLEEY